MTSQQILGADLLEILFENRNKTYGAYQLRKEYAKQLVKAVGITLGSTLVLLLFVKPNFEKTTRADDPDRVVVVTQVVPLAEPKKPDLPKPPEQPKTDIKQQNFTDHIALKNIVTDPLPPIDAMEKAGISNITTTGSDVGALQLPSPPEKSTTETQGPPSAAEPKEVIPDKQPQFPGGMQAWTAFLNRNLRSPQDLESGEKRMVIIRFHVAEDGSITNFQVEKSAGTVFDEEVIRVLKKMPRWTPAMKAGTPISVSFTQAVTFVGVEE